MNEVKEINGKEYPTTDEAPETVTRKGIEYIRSDLVANIANNLMEATDACNTHMEMVNDLTNQRNLVMAKLLSLLTAIGFENDVAVQWLQTVDIESFANFGRNLKLHSDSNIYADGLKVKFVTKIQLLN